MISNLDRYRADFEKLISQGDDLMYAMQKEFLPDKFLKEIQEHLNDEKKVSEFLNKLPSFTVDYQSWYTESLALLKQLLPDRVNDFIDLYKKTKRKEITCENYVIEDALHGLRITAGWNKEKVVNPEDAIHKFIQQLSILKSVNNRFESSLFDIRQLVQADLFDSEIDAAKELNKNKYTRGAGVIAGVVLEKHLFQVCVNHKIAVNKKNPSINDLAQLLKENDVLDTAGWRKIQVLADLRNLCVHNKESDPTSEKIEELIDGVSNIIKPKLPKTNT